MRAPESPFERYMSEEILSFAKIVSAIYHCQFQWKVTEHFRKRIKKNMECTRQKSLWFEKIYPLPKFGGNQTNSFWVLAFYSVRFKRKNWCEKTALNQTGNFYFRPKLKTAISLPIFNQLFQWFLFYIREFHLDHYVNRKTEIWRKLSIWRYTVTLKELCYVQCMDCFPGCSEWEGR